MITACPSPPHYKSIFVLLDYLFVSTWNEIISGHMKSAAAPPDTYYITTLEAARLPASRLAVIGPFPNIEPAWSDPCGNMRHGNWIRYVCLFRPTLDFLHQKWRHRAALLRMTCVSIFDLKVPAISPSRIRMPITGQARNLRPVCLRPASLVEVAAVLLSSYKREFQSRSQSREA